MQQPALVDLKGDRYVPFVEIVPIIDENFTGAALKMQVRDRKDGGALRSSLDQVGSLAIEGVSLVYAGTDTVANHVAAGRLDQEDADALGLASGANLTMSLIGIRLDEITMENMPFGPEVGDDAVLFYDVHITPSGGNKDLWFGGTFTVRAGVTQ